MSFMQMTCKVSEILSEIWVRASCGNGTLTIKLNEDYYGTLREEAQLAGD
jgi:hypothetical protein